MPLSEYHRACLLYTSFVGSGIFKSGNPAKRAQAIVKAVTNYNDPKMLAELSEDLGEAMVGINEQEIASVSYTHLDVYKRQTLSRDIVHLTNSLTSVLQCLSMLALW